MKSKLNIVLLSAVNPILDSGGLVYDMYKSLTEQGHFVHIVTKYANDNLVVGMTYLYRRNVATRLLHKIKGKIEHLLKNEDMAYYMFGLNEKQNHFPTEQLLQKIPFNPDLFIYTHSQRFLDTKNLYELNTMTNAPILNAPVDLSAITGGCHYSNDCTRYEDECGECPGLYSNKKHDLSYKTLMYKKKYVSKTNIVLLGNTWTLNHARNSSLYHNKQFFYYDVVIDEKKYNIANKDEIRKKYSIPAEQSLILFGATYITQKRKGLEYLIKALSILYNNLDDSRKKEISLVLVGNQSEKIKSLLPFDSYVLGHIHPDNLPEIYQMSDVFVSPSIQDAGPMMVVQSMMCGTPVVAFEMGNALDFIVDGVTGYKAPLCDAIGLAKGIFSLLHLSDDKKNIISKKCRETAISKVSYKAFADNILKVYSLLK